MRTAIQALVGFVSFVLVCGLAALASFAWQGFNILGNAPPGAQLPSTHAADFYQLQVFPLTYSGSLTDPASIAGHLGGLVLGTYALAAVFLVIAIVCGYLVIARAEDT